MRHRGLVFTAVVTAVFAAAGITTMAAASAAPAAAPHYKVVTKHFIVGSDTQKLETVSCPAGTKPVGGGAHEGNPSWIVANPEFAGIDESDLSSNGRGWTVSAYVAGGQGRTSFTANVVCTAT